MKGWNEREWRINGPKLKISPSLPTLNHSLWSFFSLRVWMRVMFLCCPQWTTLAPHAEMRRGCSPLVVNTIFVIWHDRMEISEPKAASRELLNSYLLSSSARCQSRYDQSSEQSSPSLEPVLRFLLHSLQVIQDCGFWSRSQNARTHFCECAEWVTQRTTDCVWSTKWAEDSTTASRCVCQQQVALAGELSFSHSEWYHWSCVCVCLRESSSHVFLELF